MSTDTSATSSATALAGNVEAPAAPRRMNAAAVMETMSGLLEAAVTRQPAEPSVSIELGANAKRITVPVVKIHAPLGCDLEALAAHAEAVRLIAVEQYVTCGARFPTEEGRVTADAAPIDPATIGKS